MKNFYYNIIETKTSKTICGHKQTANVMATKKYLTKKEVEQMFKSEFKDFLKECNTTPKDKPAKMEAWNNFVDMLQKDNQINPKSDWVHPKFIAN